MFTPEIITAFLTLTFLEIILGIDNIIFISILAGRLPEEKRKTLIRTGLFLAMFMRILMLMGISWLVHMEEALFLLITLSSQVQFPYNPLFFLLEVYF